MIKTYPAIFEPDPVGYGIYFPDIEGAATQGDNLTNALEMASDLLGIQLVWNIENNLPLPQPTPVTEIAINEAHQFIQLISVNVADYR